MQVDSTYSPSFGVLAPHSSKRLSAASGLLLEPVSQFRVVQPQWRVVYAPLAGIAIDLVPPVPRDLIEPCEVLLSRDIETDASLVKFIFEGWSFAGIVYPCNDTNAAPQFGIMRIELCLVIDSTLTRGGLPAFGEYVLSGRKLDVFDRGSE